MTETRIQRFLLIAGSCLVIIHIMRVIEMAADAVKGRCEFNAFYGTWIHQVVFESLIVALIFLIILEICKLISEIEIDE